MLSNLSSKYNIETSFNSFKDSSFKENENNFFAGAITIYLIADTVLSDIEIAPLSNLPQFSHLKPSFFRLKYFKLFFSLQFTHSIILGVKPRKHNNFNLNVLITKSIFLSVTDENENCYKILQMLLNTLYTFSETDKNIDLVISTFKAIIF